MRLRVDEDGLMLEGVYSGIGIDTDQGLFGICQRDRGIEVLLDGKVVWRSADLDATCCAPEEASFREQSKPCRERSDVEKVQQATEFVAIVAKALDRISRAAAALAEGVGPQTDPRPEATRE